MNNIEINILDFTEDPGPRYIKQDEKGHNSSGEAFYIYKLNTAFVQAIKENKQLVLDLDGVSGYPSSFLDEAIGELVYDFTLAEVSKRLVFKTDMYKRRVNQVKNETYIQWENRRINQEKVKHSANLNIDLYFYNQQGCLQTKHLS